MKNGIMIAAAVLLLCGMKAKLCAQDIHYSQFNASPLNLNPAQTGLFNGDWRFAGNYRSQWSAIPVPYKTFSIAGDMRLKTRLKNDVPALGLVINNDKAGDTRFNTTQIYISGAYIKKLTKDSSNFLSFSLQPGFSTKGFDVNAATFDNQYDGDGYNPALNPQENFAKTRVSYFDLGAGIGYLWRKTARTQANAGVSLLHLNKPRESFFDNSDVRLDMKLNVSAIVQFPVAAKLDVLPTVMYQRQGKFQETLIGAFGKYHLKPVNGMTTAVSLGIEYRFKDALIPVIGMEYRNFNVGLSYDVNMSKLVEATNRRGGFEISVIYIFKKLVPFVAKKRVCPIYM